MSKKTEAIYKKLVEGAELLKEENGKLIKKLKKNKFEILKLLIRIVEEIDPYTKGHSLNVYRRVMKIAKRLKLSKKDIDIIGKAALLHDIGKIAIDRRILNKKGKLTKEEFAMVHLHPLIGSKIVKEIEDLKTTSPHILYHHAKYEGGGYPKNNFKYERLPIGARLIAIADSYDAMRSNRPYRKAYSKEYAIKELKRCAGKEYDPKIVGLFISIINKKQKIINKEMKK